MKNNDTTKMTNYRWMICGMLFLATMINYMDRQVLSLTWKDFIAPEFHWTNTHYGLITSLFSLFYAVCMLFAGRFVDWIDTKKGFLWSIGIWSVGACLHALCGVATEWWVGVEDAAALAAVQDVDLVAKIINVSVTMFVFARLVLALGEAGNFPAANKTVAEYFPKRDRAIATSIYNSGAQIGALLAPLTIPVIAKFYGWEAAFIVIGALGFVWMGLWVFVYKKPENNPKVNKAELDYILMDNVKDAGQDAEVVHEPSKEKKLTFGQCFKFRQTWSFAVGKFMTDGVWWFFLFWTPSYLNAQFNIKMSEGLGIALIFTLYAITTVLSIFGGKLPTLIINKTGQDPYSARMKAMLIFAFFPLVVLFAQPTGTISPWFPILLISIGCSAHQSWSANIFSTVGDMFPKKAIASITGIGGMAGGIGSMLMQKGAGKMFVHADETQMAFLGFVGKPAGYFVIFCICAVAYLVGWSIMKTLVPKYSPITDL